MIGERNPPTLAIVLQAPTAEFLHDWNRLVDLLILDESQSLASKWIS